MKAYFHKGSITPCLFISTDDESVSVSIAADDSCGLMKHYGRFNVWFVDKPSNIDEYEDGLDLLKLIIWFSKIIGSQ